MEPLDQPDQQARQVQLVLTVQLELLDRQVLQAQQALQELYLHRVR
jgi:hypothetical protein